MSLQLDNKMILNYNICYIIMSICRPERITCRWIFEISEAINNVCKDSNVPAYIFCIKKGSAEQEWRHYFDLLSSSNCIKNPTVQKILNFEVDYNDYRQQNIYTGR